MLAIAAVVCAGCGKDETVVANVDADKSAPRWIVQPGSTLSFSSAWNGAPVEGRFDKWRADIRFDPNDLAGSKVEVYVDLTSIDTGSPARDFAAQGADWLDVGHNNQAVFTADRIVPSTEGGYIARGQLRMKGLTKVVDLPFRTSFDGRTAHAVGETRITRADFSVGLGDAAKAAPDMVNVKIDVTALRG